VFPLLLTAASAVSPATALAFPTYFLATPSDRKSFVLHFDPLRAVSPRAASLFTQILVLLAPALRPSTPFLARAPLII